MATDKIISLEPIIVRVKAVEIKDKDKPSGRGPGCRGPYSKPPARACVIFDDANGVEQRVNLRRPKRFFIGSESVMLDRVEDCVDEFKKHSKNGKVFALVYSLNTQFEALALSMWAGDEADGPDVNDHQLDQPTDGYLFS